MPWDVRQMVIHPVHGTTNETVDSLKSTLSSVAEPSDHAEMVSYRDIATFYAWVGDVDEALAWMDRAFTWSHNAVEFRVLASGVFDKVRDDPRFQTGLQQIRNRMGERLIQVGMGLQ